MAQIVFPHANSKHIELDAFVAAWIQYCALAFGNERWYEFIMPINNAKVAIPKHAGLDQLCRILAGRPYLHTMQATNEFFDLNGSFIEKIGGGTRNFSTGKTVNGAKLDNESVSLGKQLEMERSELLVDAERFLSADQECDDVVVGALSADITESASDISVEPLCADSSEVLTDEDVNSLVNFIHQKPFQPYYKKQAHGRELTPPGWKCRHDAYFWPRPGIGANSHETNCFAAGFRGLVERIDIQEGVCPTLDVWSGADRNTATELAKKIFNWGGVREKDPTPDEVFRVVCNAKSWRTIFPNAPMNSGWTKVAAFASEAEDKPQAIWDSRVSTAIIENLQRVITSRVPVKDFGLRLIPGRGGWRQERQAALRDFGWRSGWGSRPWSAHFAGGRLIARICKILNADVATYGAPSSHHNWTIRTVEMTLFMEGY